MSWFLKILWVLSCAFSFYLGRLPDHINVVSRVPASLEVSRPQSVGQQIQIKLGASQIPFNSKVDSGAETSSIHATDIKITWREENHRKVAYVNFQIVDDEGKAHQLFRRVFKIDDVKNANGKNTRFYIREKIWIGDRFSEIDVSLIDRSTMTFKFLLGKNALIKFGFVIDPQKDIITYKNSGPEYVYDDIK